MIGRTFEIDIRPGYKAGTKLSFSQTSEFPLKVIFTIEQIKHKFLERRGDDLYWKCLPIEKKKFKKGVIIRIPNVDGSEIVINTKNLSLKNGTKKVYTGLGMPICNISSIKNSKARGDFIIKFQLIP